MNYLVKFLLILVILTTLGNLVSQVILWAPPVSDNDSAIGGGEKKPEISVNISTVVTPDASGKVPTGGVNIAGNTASVVVPEGVQMTEGATELTLSVESISEPNEDVPVAEGETANSIDVHIDGVAEDNTVPMLITIKKLFSKGLNTTSVKMYHVENGAPVEMALVSDPANHNEFSYDPATGDVVMCVASFSEYVTVEKDLNLWEGGYDYSWYEGKSSPYTISTAEQLAGFGAIVDGGYTKPDGTTVTLTADDFAGKTILLGADIDLYGTDESGNRLSFNPIGFKWYSAKDDNGDRIGKNFQGTFDGQNHTIENLYQNGWDMGLSYSNAGGGLFAGIYNATIQNLTMKGADIVMEAVPMGTVAAYAYGECTFDNIRITSSTLQNYNWDIAAIVGGVNGKHTFSNIYIENSVTLSSLWGSFGGGIGGVIGSVYGGHNGNNSVTMENVDVACVLDVYNDVTSAYQWYAYRFCGMLIGNTNEPGADGKNAYTAQASFLNCVKDENGNDTVRVYYGDWVNYHYCKFTNQSNESGSVNWQNNYPWVRVEAGLSNPGYSNARYGHPIVDGVAVTADNHVHRENDGDCNLLIEFNQLYGGDQGVYGQPTHEGVTVQNYCYTIEYINDNTILATTYVGFDYSNKEYVIYEVNTSTGVITNHDENAANAQALAEQWVQNQDFDKVEFGGWVNAGSTIVTSIPAGNDEDIKLYPYFNSPYTARFVDQQGNILAWCLFHSGKTGDVEKARQSAREALTIPDGFSFDKWEVHITDTNGNTTSKSDYNANNFKNYTSDVTVYPVFKYNGDVSLIPIDSDGDGDTDYYQVAGYGADTGEQELVEIPGYVNGIPVTTINADAFSSYDDLHSVVIPGTVTEINSQSFTANNGTGRDTVTLYLEFDPENPDKWNDAFEYYANGGRDGILKQDWDYYMGESSCVFFLGEDGKVDLNKGYWELAKTGGFFGIGGTFVWQHHTHPYGSGTCGNEHNNKTNYTGNCDCDSCNGARRPDADYWN